MILKLFRHLNKYCFGLIAGLEMCAQEAKWCGHLEFPILKWFFFYFMDKENKQKV